MSIDLVTHSESVYSTDKGGTGAVLREVYIVRGNETTPLVPGVRKASAASAAGPAALGVNHPNANLADLVLKSKTVTSIANADFKVVLEWSRPTAGTSAVGTYLRSERTNIDTFGQPIFTTLDGEDQTTYVARMKPETRISAKKIFSLAVDHPTSLQRDYLGKTNATVFVGFFPGQWLCTRINFPDIAFQNTILYEAEFEFTKRSTWAVTVIHEDESGAPLTEPTAQASYQVYGMAEFNLLELDF